jgi:hypothetical protein
LLVAWEDSAGKPVTALVLRARPEERDALLSLGHPFHASRAGRDRIVVVLTGGTDWEEIRELVTESYRILAPKAHSAARRGPSEPVMASGPSGTLRTRPSLDSDNSDTIATDSCVKTASCARLVRCRLTGGSA